MDKRVKEILKVATKMKEGNYGIKFEIEGYDELAKLGETLNEIGKIVDRKFQECETLSKVAEKINAGLLIEDVLNYTFESFRPIIPYDRIGFALLEDEGRIVRAHWARTDFEKIFIHKGYSAKLKGSSLERIIKTGKPRVINDLRKYLKKHPKSESTKKMVREGVKSNFTCPLVVMGKPIGFIFFSSREPNTYRDMHIKLFMQIAGQLSLIVEKSRLYQRMLELNELKNKFLGIAMHDLRSPISMVNSRLDLIMEGHLGDLNSEQEKSLKGIRKWCEDMMELIEELLDVSAIESGRMNLKEKPVVIDKYLSKCIDFNKPLAEAKKMKLTLKVDKKLSKVVLDPDRIYQVLNNLIGNAIKYSPKNTTVSVQAEKKKHDVWISVSDQGQGILKREIPKVFEYFGKGSAHPTGGESSTGLGLAICKRMVEAHGGRIWVESARRKGSTFIFAIPVR